MRILQQQAVCVDALDCVNDESSARLGLRLRLRPAAVRLTLRLRPGLLLLSTCSNYMYYIVLGSGAWGAGAAACARSPLGAS